MARLTSVAIMTALALGLVGCETAHRSDQAASASPSYSGPAWEAYKAGRDFGRTYEGSASLPAQVARSADSDGLSDALDADMANANLWCTYHLPSDLKAAHEDQDRALTAGCVGGILPLFDHPEFWADQRSS